MESILNLMRVIMAKVINNVDFYLATGVNLKWRKHGNEM
jgi:hypothetical protein